MWHPKVFDRIGPEGTMVRRIGGSRKAHDFLTIQQETAHRAAYPGPSERSHQHTNPLRVNAARRQHWTNRRY